MPCYHKFQNYLNLTDLDFNPTTLIVGTFNPEWPENNYAQWFYGRTNNNYFRNVLPRIYNQKDLTLFGHKEWKENCRNNLIALTDLISCIEDAESNLPHHNTWLKGYSDNKIAQNFEGHRLVNVIELLINNPSISNVYFTRGINERFWSNIWEPIRNYCLNNGVGCKELLTPFANARFQQGIYNQQNPTHQLNLADFILMKWQEKWHQI